MTIRATPKKPFLSDWQRLTGRIVRAETILFILFILTLLILRTIPNTSTPNRLLGESIMWRLSLRGKLQLLFAPTFATLIFSRFPPLLSRASSALQFAFLRLWCWSALCGPQCVVAKLTCATAFWAWCPHYLHSWTNHDQHI